MKIAVCVPFRGVDCKVYFMHSVMRTVWPEGSEVMDFSKIGGTWAKSITNMIQESLKWGADFIVIMACDIRFGANDIAKLIGHNKDIISGISFNRMPPFRCHVADKIDVEKKMFSCIKNPENHHGLERVCSFGAELVVFKKEIFAKMPQPWFFGPDTIGPNSVMSEDYYFCFQAKKLGIEVWVDWDVQIGHLAEGLLTLNGNLVAAGI